jgi:hypothetical protein
MITFGTIVSGSHGTNNLFKNSYVQNLKGLSFYRKIEDVGKRLDLLTKIADELSSTKSFVYLCDKDDPSIIYSLVCYEIVDNKTIVYYAYTKYPFRGCGFCKDLLNYIESLQPTNTLEHRIPRTLTPKWGKLWEKYQRTQPYYPISKN